MDKEYVDMSRQAQYNSEFNRRFARNGKTTYGKPFRKKSSKGKFKKGTMIRYKYVNGRRVGAVKSRK
jgi:hypothetical protein